jgi:hypothetical protein
VEEFRGSNRWGDGRKGGGSRPLYPPLMDIRFVERFKTTQRGARRTRARPCGRAGARSVSRACRPPSDGGHVTRARCTGALCAGGRVDIRQTDRESEKATGQKSILHPIVSLYKPE